MEFAWMDDELVRFTRPIRNRWWRAVHNLVAHPMLEFYRPWGERLHDWTAERMYDDEADEQAIPHDGPVQG